MDCLPHIHVAAYHAEAHYRNDVPGLGILCRETNSIAGVGSFSNSIGRQSNYAIIGKYLFSWGPVRFGAVGGAIDGYDINGGRAIPMGALIASYKHAHFTFVPPVESLSPMTIQVSFTLPSL